MGSEESLMKRIQDDGTVYWMNSAKEVHREGIPAVIWDEGQSSWMRENSTHRDKKNGRATLDPVSAWPPEEDVEEAVPVAIDEEDDDDWAQT